MIQQTYDEDENGRTRQGMDEELSYQDGGLIWRREDVNRQPCQNGMEQGLAWSGYAKDVYQQINSPAIAHAHQQYHYDNDAPLHPHMASPNVGSPHRVHMMDSPDRVGSPHMMGQGSPHRVNSHTLNDDTEPGSRQFVSQMQQNWKIPSTNSGGDNRLVEETLSCSDRPAENNPGVTVDSSAVGSGEVIPKDDHILSAAACSGRDNTLSNHGKNGMRERNHMKSESDRGRGIHRDKPKASGGGGGGGGGGGAAAGAGSSDGCGGSATVTVVKEKHRNTPLDTALQKNVKSKAISPKPTFGGHWRQ